jgi:hypothetical protein
VAHKQFRSTALQLFRKIKSGEKNRCNPPLEILTTEAPAIPRRIEYSKRMHLAGASLKLFPSSFKICRFTVEETCKQRYALIIFFTNSNLKL